MNPTNSGGIDTQVLKAELFWTGISKVLQLTEHGKLKLQTFPVEVVQDCYKQLQHSSVMGDKVQWLIEQCNTRCKVNDIKPAWGNYFNGVRSLNIDQKAPLSVKSNTTPRVSSTAPKEYKAPEVYSTRDLSKYKRPICLTTLKRGLSFLSDMIPQEEKSLMLQLINGEITLESLDLIGVPDIVSIGDKAE